MNDNDIFKDSADSIMLAKAYLRFAFVAEWTMAIAREDWQLASDLIDRAHSKLFDMQFGTGLLAGAAAARLYAEPGRVTTAAPMLPAQISAEQQAEQEPDRGRDNPPENELPY